MDNTTLSDAPSCFVISSFSKQMDDVFDAIRDAVSRLGYGCQRADTYYHGNEITGEIHDRIRQSAFLVADLSEPSPNVFYEVGFARGIGKRVILLSRDEPAKQFDLRNVQQIVYETLRELRQRLHETVRQEIGDTEKQPTRSASASEVPGRSEAALTPNDFLVAYTTQIEQATDSARKASAYLNRARVYSSLQLVEQGIEDLESARKLNPNDPQIYIDLGYVYNQVKRFDEAIQVLELALAMAPDSVKAYTHTAFALNGLEKYDEAIETAKEALAIDPNSDAAKRVMNYAIAQRSAIVIDQNDVPTPVEAIDLSEDSVLITSRAYTEQGQYSLALSVLERAIERGSGSGNLYCAKGAVLNMLSRHEEALESFRRATELEPNDWRNHYEYGGTLVALTRYRESLPFFRTALELQPDDEDAIVQMGFVLCRNGDTEGGLAAYNTVLGDNPNHVRALLNRGYLYNILNRREEALLDYENALSLDAKNVEGWVQKAFTLAGMERLQEALSAVQRALELEPGHRSAIKVMTDIYRMQRGQFRT